MVEYIGEKFYTNYVKIVICIYGLSIFNIEIKDIHFIYKTQR